MIPNKRCEELERLKQDAAFAFREARAIRRTRDVSIQEDCQLAREVRCKIDALILHLLTGHGSLPCPSGERPIISPAGVSHGAAVQEARSSCDHTRDSKKAITLTGTVSSDAAIILSDKDHKAWKVANPEALTDNAGEHVRVTARIAASANEIFITAVEPSDDAILTAKRDDCAFRR